MNAEPNQRTFDGRLHRFALVCVSIGVVISLLAGAFVWVTRGEVPSAMFEGTLFAIVAAYPVWRTYRAKSPIVKPPANH